MRKRRFLKHSSKGFAILMSIMMAATTVQPVAAKESKKDDKTETVYVNADADGTINKVTVSDWLQNHDGSAEIKDYSTLSNIKNVKGDETFTQDADGNIVWNANGNDIFYQGETSENLPVAVKVSYYLDGKKMEPKEMAGKSGKVKIRFDYYNNTMTTQKVDGKEYQVNTPFSMITAVILPEDTFKNVKAENGNVISDGKNNIVVGMGFPGLQDSLKLSTYEELDDIDIPDYVEITADATDFELALTATAATTGVLDKIDTANIDDVDDLQEDIDKLTDGSKELVDGTKDLLDGMEEFSSSMNTYTDGVDSADKGSKDLKDGLNKIDANSDKLTKGADDLKEGINTLKKGTAILKQGVKDYTGGANKIEEGINGDNGLKAGLTLLDKGFNDKNSGLKAGVYQYTTGASEVKKGIDTLSSQVDELLSKPEMPTKEELKSVMSAAKKVNQNANSLSKQVKQISQGIQKLNQLPGALKQYKSGTDQIIAGLRKGAGALDGAATGMANAQLPAIEEDLLTNASREAKDQVSSKLEEAEESANSQAKDKIESAVESAASKAESEANSKISAAKSALDSISTEGMTDEQKQAISNAKGKLDNVNVSVSTPEVSISLDDVSSEVNLKDVTTEKKVTVSGLSKAVQLDSTIDKLDGTLSGLYQNLSGIEKLTEIEPDDINDTLNALQDEDKNLKVIETYSKRLIALSEDMDNLDKLESGVKELQTGASQLTSNNKKLRSGVDQLSSGISAAHKGVDKLSVGVSQLTGNNMKLNKGASDLDSGAAKLKDGSKTLANGVEQYTTGVGTAVAGSEKLKEGLDKLSNANSKIKDGVGKLVDGSGDLHDGMVEMDEDGIQKIADLAGEDLDTVVNHFKAIKDADKQYNSFAGINKKNNGSVKFIIETDAIEKED